MENYTIKQLREMAKEKDIKYCGIKGKDELCKLMNIPFDGITSCYKHLQTIRVNPKAISLTNDETKEEHNFNSLYACSKHFKINPARFTVKAKVKNEDLRNSIIIKVNDVPRKFTIRYE